MHPVSVIGVPHRAKHTARARVHACTWGHLGLALHSGAHRFPNPTDWSVPSVPSAEYATVPSLCPNGGGAAAHTHVGAAAANRARVATPLVLWYPNDDVDPEACSPQRAVKSFGVGMCFLISVVSPHVRCTHMGRTRGVRAESQTKST